MAQLQSVNSSMIDAVGYDGSNVLTVRFTNGNTWQYEDVSPSLYVSFMDARSKGKFFSQAIKDLPSQQIG